MAAPQTILFGRSGAMTPVPFSYYGQDGWFALPQGWFTRPNSQNPSELEASPNADFNPVYYCTLSQDSQTFVFQDTLLAKLTGTDGNNNG